MNKTITEPVDLTTLQNLALYAFSNMGTSGVMDWLDIDEDEACRIRTYLDILLRDQDVSQQVRIHVVNGLSFDVVTHGSNQLEVQPVGYQSQKQSHADSGAPVAFNWYDHDNKLQLSIWTDPDQVTPDVFDLEGLKKPEEPKVQRYHVEVCRTGYGHTNFDVEAASVEEAQRIAEDEAGSYSYSEKEADYEIQSVVPVSGE